MDKHMKKPNRPVVVTNKHSGATHVAEGNSNPLGKKISETTGIDRDASPAPRAAGYTAGFRVGDAKRAPGETQSKAGSKKIELDSLESYLRAYYESKIKSLNLKIVKKLNQNVKIDDFQRQKLLAQAVDSDPTLERTRSLMFLANDLEGYGGIERALRDFTRDVASRHPALMNAEVGDWFPSRDAMQSVALEDLWQRVAAFDKKPDEIEPDNEELKAKAGRSSMGKACRNAFMLAVLWRYYEGVLPFSELLRSLRRTAFASALPKSKLPDSLVEYLTNSDERDKAKIADLFQWHTLQVDEERQKNAVYVSKVTALETQIEKMNQALSDSTNRAIGLEERIAVLERQLAEGSERARVQGVHFRDDLERQRSRTILALEQELPVLQDVLTALDRDPPKVTVAKEYVGSSIDNLSEVVRSLKG